MNTLLWTYFVSIFLVFIHCSFLIQNTDYMYLCFPRLLLAMAVSEISIFVCLFNDLGGFEYRSTIWQNVPPLDFHCSFGLLFFLCFHNLGFIHNVRAGERIYQKFKNTNNLQENILKLEHEVQTSEPAQPRTQNFYLRSDKNLLRK